MISMALFLKAGVVNPLHLLRPIKGVSMEISLKIPEACSRWGGDVLLGALTYIAKKGACIIP
jgi:hypothetical protein